MNNRFRWIMTVLVCIICLYFGSEFAHAEQITSGTCGDNTAWSFDEATGTLTISGSGRMNAYEQWERPWKHLNDVVTRVVVKGTVDHIGDSSFNRLFNVTEIIIEEGVTSVGRNALQNTKISSIDLPDSIEEMGMVALGSSHNLKTLRLPANLKVVSQLIITDCPLLSKIYVGNQVTVVEDRAFANSNSATIYFSGDAPSFHPESFKFSSVRVYYPKDNETWTEAVRQPYEATAISWIPYDPENPEDIVEPEIWIADLGVALSQNEEICEWIIHGESNPDNLMGVLPGYMDIVGSVIFEDGIPYVVLGLFNGFPYLQKATLANSVKQIQELAFAACPALSEVILPEGLVEIGHAAFVDAVSLETIEFPQTLEIIRGEAFANCMRLKQITFHGSAPEIGADAFAGVTATVYYPAEDDSWKNIVHEDFGGALTWVRQGDPVEETTETETQEPTETETQKSTEPEQPTGNETQQSTGQDVSDESVDDTENKITKELTESVISAEILEAAKGKEIYLVLNMGEYQWTISGEEITGEKLQSVDMTVELDTKHIPQETVYAVAGESPSQQLSLAHNGDFGFLAELTVSVGEDYAGQTGRLYYYNENHALELIDSSVVGDDGRIALEFTHASDYVIVIGDTVSSIIDNRWWVISIAVFVVAGVVGGTVCLKRNSKR